MNGRSKVVTAAALLIATVLLGCSYHRGEALKPVGLPEDIYKTPTDGAYIGSNVGIFNFRAPDYADGMGRVAGECLYQELLKRGIFSRLTYEEQSEDLRKEKIMAVARAKGYELVITGDLPYYFEGSLHYPSRVDQRMEVIGVDEEIMLWYAKAVDIGFCYPYRDYLVVEGYGRSAPSTRELFERNAQKFCKLLYEGMTQNVRSGISGVSATHGVADSDYDEAVNSGSWAPSSSVFAETRDVTEATTSPVNLPQVEGEEGLLKGADVSTERMHGGEAPPHEADRNRQQEEVEKFMTEPIHFAFNDFRLSTEAKAVLSTNADWLKRHPNSIVEIQGHCDERGPTRLNTALGTQRAIHAKRYLVELGIDGGRLLPVSYGENIPLDAGHHEDAWARNRRAEFIIVGEQE